MNVDEVLARAWKAVQSSGIPESLYETAFREAVNIIRSTDELQTPAVERTTKTPARGGGGATRPRQRRGPATSKTQTEIPDEDDFFSKLAEEAGVAEDDLRDILQLTSDGRVLVTQATRRLGANTAEQARIVVALVAGARAFGLGERPVDGRQVRDEVKRKNCFDSPNYAASTIGKLSGFNPGANQNQIVTTSRWDGDFRAAVDKAHGRTGDTD